MVCFVAHYKAVAMFQIPYTHTKQRGTVVHHQMLLNIIDYYLEHGVKFKFSPSHVGIFVSP